MQKLGGKRQQFQPIPLSTNERIVIAKHAGQILNVEVMDKGRGMDGRDTSALRHQINVSRQGTGL